MRTIKNLDSRNSPHYFAGMNTTAKNRRVVEISTTSATSATLAAMLLAAAAVFVSAGCQKAEPPKKSMTMAERLEAEAAAEKLIESNKKKIQEFVDLAKRLDDLHDYLERHPEEKATAEKKRQEIWEQVKILEDDNKELTAMIGKIRRGEDVD